MRTGTKVLLVVAVLLLNSISAMAQLSGVKTIPGTYASIAAAITDLNTQGVVAPGVTFNVAAGYTETLPSLTAGLITTTATAGGPIVFQKSGAGANPLITAYSPGASTTVDYIIALAGSDYVTFDGIDLQENASNTTPTMQMEWGYALVKKQAVTPFDGCENVTIKNCTITLSRANTASSGIYLGNHVSTITTALAITATTDANNNNKFYSNTIQNCTNGIWMSGFAAATPYTLYDQNNDIGGVAAPTGNTIRDFGGTATTAYGVYGVYQNNLSVRYNTVADSATTNGTAAVGVLYGIYHGTATNSSTTLSNNNVTITRGPTLSNAVYGVASTIAGTGTTTINNNTMQNWTSAGGNTGTIYFIYNSGTTGIVVINSNTISNNTLLNTTGSCYFIYNSNSTQNITCTSNVITNNAKTGAGGTVYGYYNFGSPAGGTSTHTGNTVSNITVTGATTFYGLYQATSTTQNEILTSNTIASITGGTSSTYGLYLNYGAAGSLVNGNTVTNINGGGTVYGIEGGNTSSSIALSVYQNTVDSVSSSGASAVYGIYLAGTTGLTANTYRNNIFRLNGSNAGSLVYGIYVSSGTNQYVYNNFVSDLTAGVATGLNAIGGIYIAGGTTVGAYFNTVFLNATSSGATFGTSGIYESTTPTVELRDNIVANLSTPGASGGFTVAHRRSTIAALGTYSSASNNNDFYVNTGAGVQRYFYSEGSAEANCDSTIAAYKARVASRDAASFAENPPFINVATTPYNLHLNTGSPTQCESGGTTVSSPVAITVDYDGAVRNVSTPDVGADEFAGTGLDLSPPSISYTALGNTASTSNRSFTPVTITDATGVNTTAGTRPRVYYKRMTDANTWNDNTSGTAGWKYAEAGAGGSPFTFTINYALLSGGTGVAVGDTVQYFVIAQDVTLAINVGINSGTFTATPVSVALTAAAFPIGGSINNYAILAGITGTFTVGTSASPLATYPSITAAIADVNSKVLTGPVTLVLIDPAYTTPAETFPIVINQNGGSSGTNVLTIKPTAGGTPSISGSSASAIFKLNGADYVTIDGSNNGTSSRDMTIANTNAASTTAAIQIASLGTGLGATNNIIKNCTLAAGSNTLTTYGISVGAGIGVAGDDNDALTIQNNVISKAYYGIYAVAGSTGVNNTLNITGNSIGSAVATDYIGKYGMNISQASGATITQNTVYNIIGSVNTNPFGIVLGTGVVSSSVTRNDIHNLQYTGTSGYGGKAIDINTGSASSALTIANNIIYGILGDGWNSFSSDAIIGVRVLGTTGGVNIYYNSINLTGSISRASATTDASACLYVVGTATALDIRNNALANSIENTTGAATAFAIYSDAANTAFTTINRNDYFATGLEGVLGHLGATNDTTITAWRTATGQDVNSMANDPLFVSSTNLQPYAGSPLLAAGTPIGGITVDYLGVARSGSTPSIGAYENGASATMTYTSSTTTQNNTSNVAIGSTDQQIIGVQVVMTGTLTPLSATRLYLGTNGSTAASDIANAKVWYTGTSSTFATGTQFGSTVVSPSGAFQANGSQVLSNGTNYFWLAYDIAGGAIHGHVVDGQCDSMIINSVVRIPTVAAPAGSRTVTGTATISAKPDSLVETLATNSSKTDTVVIKNSGNGPLTWSIADENARPAMINEKLLHYAVAGPALPKGMDYPQTDHPDTSAGPDAFGYKLIDSDAPGGPVFSWVDISGSGTTLDSTSAWVSTGTFSGYDEGYYPVQLPSTFNFYGVNKDSIFIGSNGYVSFKRPTADAFTNATIPTAGGPIDNFVAGWWDDLQVSGGGARVFYGTSGGNFVIQYQNIPLYNGTVPNYTFEIILSPTGTITTQYLAMAINAGTLASSSIGIENATGTVGLAALFNGNHAGYMHNNLAIKFYLPDAPWLSENPLSGSVNPGDSVKVAVTFNSTGLVDSSYRAVVKIGSNDPVTPLRTLPIHLTVGSGSTTTVSVPVANSWNLVSLPVSNPTSGNGVQQVYTNSATNSAYKFTSTYVAVSTLNPGTGYWVKSTSAYSQSITGTPIDSITVPLNFTPSPWNIIGSISTSIDTSSARVTPSAPGLRGSAYFRYASGYSATDSIKPGGAYWVKSNFAGSLHLHKAGVPAAPSKGIVASRSIEDLNVLTIEDANGGLQKLYFGTDGKNEIPVNMFALPPQPPAGMFDARFVAEGGIMVQTHAEEVSDVIEMPIAIQSVAYPLTVSWKVSGTASTYELSDGSASHAVRGEGTLKIQNSAVNHLTLKVTSSSTLPKEFALSQNYPNPFNPTTNIKYALPVDSKLTMEIYNILGQKVRTLLAGEQAAGYHSIEWNGKGNEGQQLASGVYFLQMSAAGANGKKFSELKKLMLLK